MLAEMVRVALDQVATISTSCASIGSRNDNCTDSIAIDAVISFRTLRIRSQWTITGIENGRPAGVKGDQAPAGNISGCGGDDVQFLDRGIKPFQNPLLANDPQGAKQTR